MTTIILILGAIVSALAGASIAYILGRRGSADGLDLESDLAACQAARAELETERRSLADTVDQISRNAASKEEQSVTLRGQRDRCVEALLGLHSSLSGSAHRFRIQTALEGVGLETIEPQRGDPVDLDQHCVLSVNETDDPDLDRTVSETVRVGFKEGDRLRAEAEVVEFRVPN